MQWFSYLDKREVLQQEYSQPPILPSPHFWWVVNVNTFMHSALEFWKYKLPLLRYDQTAG